MATPVSDAPLLRRVNGFGCSVVGHFHVKQIAPAYFTLYAIFALWIPIVPLLVYIVTREPAGYRFYGKLTIAEFCRRYGARGVLLLFGSAIVESALIIVFVLVMMYVLTLLFYGRP